MSLLEKIKGLFGGGKLPEETQLLLSGVTDVAELRNGLDEIVTRNEVEARDISREVEKLAKMEAAQKERIHEGNLTAREKTNILREIKRLRRRMDGLERRYRIHQENIDLHLGIFDRITEMEAMELKRVTRQQIEEIDGDYQEKLEAHRDVVRTARASEGTLGIFEDSAEAAELAALEAEILAEMGGKPEAEEESAEPADEVEEAEELEGSPKVEEAPVEAAPAEEAPQAGRRPLQEELARLEAGEETVERDERALELE